MKKLISLLAGDFRNLRRDSITLILVIAPVLLAAAIKFALPLITDIVMRELGFNLKEYYEFIIGILILVIPMLLGMLAGFMILDEKDDNVLAYLSVTPLTRNFYITYRTALPVILSFFLSYFFLFFTNFVKVDYFYALPLILMVSMEAPLAALFLGTFAGNKVEGLALSKALGIFLIAPAAGYFVKSNWQYIAGIVPPYWVFKAFMSRMNSGAEYWLYIIIGFLVHTAAVTLLLKRFKNRIV